MLVIAHRGARASQPENTLLAFEQALNDGAVAIELDVHQHHDEFLVIHDAWVNRTTNGQGHVSWYSLSQLKALDAGKKQSVPTLKEVFRRLAGRCALNIELKGLSDLAPLIAHLNYALDECGFSANQLLISSFNHHWLAGIREKTERFPLAPLTASKPLGLCRFAQRLGAYSVNIEFSVIDEELVNDAHSRGLKVFVYTVNREQDWRRLQQLSVDGVFCDAPGHAIEFLGSNGAINPAWTDKYPT